MRKKEEEFKKINSERNLEEKTGWKLQKRRFEPDQKIQDDSIDSPLRAKLWGIQSAWSLPCLKDRDSLWLRSAFMN